jgi:LPS export ABC transporter protein LptC
MILAVALAAGCSRDSAPTAEKSGEKVPQQVLTGVRLRQTSVKGLLWVLDADKGVSYGADEPMELTNQTLIARDSVVVTTPNGERLETESLRWDPKAQKVTTEDPFRFTRGRDVVTGVGISTDPDLTHYTIKKQVRAEVRDEAGKNLLEGADGDSAAGR